MTIKPLFQCLALAAMSCCVVIATLIVVHLVDEFIDLAIAYTGSITRLIP